MATDYDAPRRSEADDLAEDSLEELKARRNENQSGVVDVDESETAESFELPGADLSGLSGEDLTVRVVPKQADEFTCSKCFLVHHRSRLAEGGGGRPISRDCAQARGRACSPGREDGPCATRGAGRRPSPDDGWRTPSRASGPRGR